MHELSPLMDGLVGARDFEAAADQVLRALQQVVEEALASSPYAGRGRVLRGVVHLRPDEGYRRLAVREGNSGRSRQGKAESTLEGDVSAPLLVSATAWRWLVQHRCAVFIDVGAGEIRPRVSQVPGALPENASFEGHESRQRMLGRKASHVCVLPLRGVGGHVEGMISLEVGCPAATGQDFIWEACCERLQTLADMAALHLVGLPPRPVETPQVDEFLPVIGAAMSGLLPILRVFARQDETLLISGPTGAGKSRLARWCHEQSRRKQGPFEVLDLMTVPEELQMAELFGWRKGAFTGAVRDSAGSVQRAQGGTLFIDEVDKLSLKAQAGLLHVLEERNFRVLGESGEERRADVRFIVGTNTDLQAAVRAGRFREDLYYRIHVLPVQLPPLEQRRDEIPAWAQHMASRRHRQEHAEGEAHLTAEAAQSLQRSSWPGNLRQLDNVVRRAYTLALVKHDESPREVRVTAQHVERALAYEQRGPPQEPLTEAFRSAAQAFIQEAQRLGTGLELDLADALKGFILSLGAEQLGLDQIFTLLGREYLLKNRNHYKAFKREMEKIEALYKAIGRPPPLDLLLRQEDKG
jgi:MoxR-like ATPase